MLRTANARIGRLRPFSSSSPTSSASTTSPSRATSRSCVST